FTIKAFAEETKKNIDELKAIINCWTEFSNCLKYIQLGNPDHVIITNNKIANALRNNLFNGDQNVR
ncbi:hypothetical protein QUF80_05900, partial [Desulfococcaceae bacterium HSG8]|nr:hypothetical protein [Desulfococcaceae bacterium HSG8]